MSLWGTLSSLNLKDVASAARSVGESLVTAVTNADDLVGGGGTTSSSVDSTGGEEEEGAQYTNNNKNANNNYHTQNVENRNHQRNDHMEHDGWNTAEDDDLDLDHPSTLLYTEIPPSSSTLNEDHHHHHHHHHHQGSTSSSSVTSSSSSSSYLTTVKPAQSNSTDIIHDIPIDDEGWPTENEPLHESMLDGNETTQQPTSTTVSTTSSSTASSSLSSAFLAASSFAVKQLPITETIGVLSKIQATVVGKDTIIEDTSSFSIQDNNNTTTTNNGPSFFGNSLVNVMGKLKDTIITANTGNSNTDTEDKDPWLTSDIDELNDVSLNDYNRSSDTTYNDEQNNNNGSSTTSAYQPEEFQKLLSELQKLRYRLVQTEDVLQAEKQRCESFRKHAIEMEERLNRTVGDRESVDNEWQNRVITMQTEWKNREKERLNELATLRERDTVLSGQISEANRKNEDLEQRINRLQIAIGTEKEKAEDSRRALERVKQESAAALRETPVDSVAMQETVATAERYKQHANEATMRLKEATDEMDTLRTQLSTLQEQVRSLQEYKQQQETNSKPAAVNTDEEDRLRTELEHTRQQIEDLQASLETAETGVADAGAETVHLRSTIATLQEEIESLHGQIQRFEDDKQKAMDTVQNHERERVAALLSALDAAQAQLTSLETAHDDASDQMMKLENDIKQLRENNKELLREQQHEEHVRETLERNFQEAMSKCTRLETERKEQEHTIETLRKEKEEAEYAINQAKQRYEQAEATIASITHGMEGKATEEIQTLRVTIQTLENTIQSNEHRYKETVDQLTEQLNHTKQQYSTSLTTIQELENKTDELQRNMASIRAEQAFQVEEALEKSRNEELVAQKTKEYEHEAEKTALTEKITNLTEAYDHLRKSIDAKETIWKAKIADKETELAEQQEQFMQNHRTALQKLEERIQTDGQKYENLVRENDELKHQFRQYDEQHHHSNKESQVQIDELQNKLQERINEYNKLQNLLEETETKLNQATVTNRELRTQFDNVTIQVQELQQTIDKQTAKETELMLAIQKASEETEQANRAVVQEKGNTEKLRLSLTATMEAHKRLQNAFDRIQADFRESINREHEAEQATERNSARIKELEGLVSSLRNNLEQTVLTERDTNELVQELRQENGHLREQIENFTNKVTSYSDNTYQLQKELNEAHSHVQDLTAKLQSIEDIHNATKMNWMDREQILVSSLSAAEAKVQSLITSLEDNNRLKADLQVKEIDLETAQTSLINLQIAFEGVQASKLFIEQRERNHEQERQTLHQRVKDLEKELIQCKAANNGSVSIVSNASSSDTTKGTATQAQIRITQLQQTVHELRTALEDTKLRAMDNGNANVDKRLINQLLLAYFQAQQDAGGDVSLASVKARDALLITANFLGMNDNEREKIGLSADVLGQTLPDRGVTSAVKSVGGLLAGLWGSSSSVNNDGPSTPVPSSKHSSNPHSEDSLGAAFVQFLLSDTAEDDFDNSDTFNNYGSDEQAVVSSGTTNTPSSASSIDPLQSPGPSPARSI